MKGLYLPDPDDPIIQKNYKDFIEEYDITRPSKLNKGHDPRVITYEEPIGRVGGTKWHKHYNLKQAVKEAKAKNTYLYLDHAECFKYKYGKVYVFSNYGMNQEDIEHAERSGYKVIPPIYSGDATTMVKYLH
jgi:hypothetical protein